MMYENFISILSSIIKLRVVNNPIHCEFIPEVQSSFFQGGNDSSS